MEHPRTEAKAEHTPEAKKKFGKQTVHPPVPEAIVTEQVPQFAKARVVHVYENVAQAPVAQAVAASVALLVA